MDPQYAERYRKLYEQHWWWRARSEFIVETLRRIQPSQRWREILDVGCGDGLFFPLLREFGEVEGVEPFSDLLDPQNPDRSRIHNCAFDENFQPRKQYSLILMLDVLEHLENPAGALKHVRELLEPGGTVLITVPAFMVLWTNHDEINHHFTRYTKSELRRISANAGLDTLEDRYIYHWTVPVKMAFRIAERVLRSRPKPARVPMATANEFLYRITRLEQRTLSRLPMPIGSSLMTILRHKAAN